MQPTHEPGIYDDICTFARESTNAQVCFLAVINGNKGSGFSIQAQDNVSPDAIATILETVAKEIRTNPPKR